MNTFSLYVFREAARPLFAILASLVTVAILTQGLGQLDLFISDRHAVLAFFEVTALTLPQDIALVLPFATLFAVLIAFNRMRSESEVAVAYGAGLSPRRLAEPILKLATLVALAHLAINVLLQPIAYREMREVAYSVQTDVVSSLVREGAFTYPSPNLTLYARERGSGGELHDVLIDDARGQSNVTYTAQSGAIITVSGAPAMVLRNGEVQRQKDDGSIELLDFDRYVLQLGVQFEEPSALYLKSSDRFLGELFRPDLTQYYDQRNARAFVAEGHGRLAAPLLNIALALIAVSGSLGGSATRRGYGLRIALTAAIGLALRLAAFLLQPAAVSHPDLNVLQYALPISAGLIALARLSGRSLPGKLRRLARSSGPTPLRAAVLARKSA